MFHKFVILLKVGSLFWPRLEPKRGISFYTLRYLPIKCRGDRIGNNNVNFNAGFVCPC